MPTISQYITTISQNWKKKSAWLVVVEVVMMAVMEFIISVLQENTYFKKISFHYCGSQPPWGPPDISAPWYSHPCVVLYSLPHCIEQTFVTNRMLQKWQSMTSKLGHERHQSFLDCSVWRKPGVMSWGHSSNLREKFTWWRTEAPCQQPRECVILELDPQTSGAFRWLQPHKRPQARITQLSPSQNPEPQKPWGNCLF